MRALLLAATLVLAGPQFAAAAPPIAQRTNLSFDSGHGTQVEYLQSGGKAFLWYPGNAVVLPGHWKFDGGTAGTPARICFRYGPNSYNPVTHVYGDKWECEGMALYTSLLAEQATGDVFGLAHRTAVPFVLQSQRASLMQLAKQAGAQAKLGATTTPTRTAAATADAGMSANAKCADILAKAHTSRDAMLMAGILYYHGEWMGQHCITVDYQKAFALLHEAGDTRNSASLLADLKLRAASGNPKAISALDRMGVSR